MRKDYITVLDKAETSETDFVKDHWTEVWNKMSSGSGALEQIVNRSEFRIMEPFLKKLQSGARVLDGGCGLGAWTVGLSSMGYNVTGIDISEKTIHKLREMFPLERFETGDLRQTRFRDGEFDAYFAWGVFEHFEAGLAPCLKEAHRILKKDGYLFVSVPFHNGRLWKRDHMPTGSAAKSNPGESGAGKPLRFYQWRLTREELRRELEMQGFHVHSVTPIHRETGVHRMLVTDYGLAENSLVYKVLKKLISPVISAEYAANMIIAVGQNK